ncbi:recombination mediator RecR [Lichenicoccus roseus]|uniref:Recombination protein RecR n=1 Tax=Lichenicoccus roseus TaxID=2683649 RepID=A0A5R9J903_9PROT|nr:recombination mediator RecR [Lichenicoccus roseus]TLU73027.1 recombination protein RecR [Lichenicoccus roseus]
MGGPEIERLIELLGKLPGLGPRSARRAALGLLRQPQARLLPLANAMEQAARTVRTCARCGNLDSRDPCTVCSDPNRDQGLICVVEGVGDLWALERAGVHRGLYHVLGGTLSPLGGIGPEDLNLSPLLARLEAGGVREVILALGATVEGATTQHWLSERLAPSGATISRVGQGVPMGGALDVLDDGTLAAALMARRAS